LLQALRQHGRGLQGKIWKRTLEDLNVKMGMRGESRKIVKRK